MVKEAPQDRRCASFYPTNDPIPLEDIEWTLEDERPFTDDEKNSVTSLEVVQTMDGSLSVKCSIKEGSQTYIWLAEELNLPVGTYLDKDKVILKVWRRLNQERYYISIDNV